MERPSLTRRLRAWPYWPLVGLVLGVKALVLLHGAFTYLQPWEQGITDARTFFDIWNRWDSLNYLRIAEFGYEATGETRHLLAFYPLYPALVRMLEPLCGSFLAAGFWISTVMSVSAAILFHRLSSLDRPADADRAVFFLLVFPTSYFLHIPYTESLFLTLCCGSLLAARGGRWAMAGLLGACAGLTRINGLALCAALLLEVWLAWRGEKRFRREWLFVLLAPAGALGFLLVNVWVGGDAFAFVRLQQDYFNRTVDWPWSGYFAIWKTFLTGPSSEALVMRSPGAAVRDAHGRRHRRVRRPPATLVRRLHARERSADPGLHAPVGGAALRVDPVPAVPADGPGGSPAAGVRAHDGLVRPVSGVLQQPVRPGLLGVLEAGQLLLGLGVREGALDVVAVEGDDLAVDLLRGLLVAGALVRAGQQQLAEGIVLGSACFRCSMAAGTSPASSFR